MAGNTSLNKAASAKQDEFYTQISDIEKELRHYRKHFAGKTVFCNCDDPFESNFFKYFVLNFNRLGLARLIATCYAGSPIVYTQMNLFGEEEEVVQAVRAKKPYKVEVTQVYDATGDGGVDMLDVAELFRTGQNSIELLEGDGDFRSPECLALLDEADIVVTNPPFSLFREYVATLMAHNKKFIIIGNKNAITYKEIFPLLQDNLMWLGAKPMGGSLWFQTPDGFSKKSDKVVDGIKLTEVPCCWFTNLDIKKRHEQMILVRRYDQDAYLRYVNFDAIEVSSTSDIPSDYSGLMGVPVTFMDKYNPEQFEIVGSSKELSKPMKDFAEKGTYISGGPRFYIEQRNGDFLYRRLYDRIVIRNLHPEEAK